MIKFETLISPFDFEKDLTEQLETLDQAEMNPCWNHAAWEAFFLEKAKGRYLLSMANGKTLLGFSLFQLVHEEGLAHLLKIAVASEFRRQSIARNMFADLLPYLKQLEICKIFLEVEESNSSAIAFYQSQGFEKLHTMKHFYGLDRHGVSMLWQFS